MLANDHVHTTAHGRSVYGAAPEKQRPQEDGSFSWLASLFAARQSLPTHLDEKHAWESNTSVRLRALKRSLLRRIPKLDTSRVRPLTRPPSPDDSSSLAIPTPATIRFILLCSLWYTSSALSSNTGKSILTRFRYPVTLTFLQFGFVAAYCLLFMSPLVRFTTLRRPSNAILQSTLPMGIFQVGGHIFSSMAISRIPVSTTHTIKALSPLFTVAAYALLFGVKYSAKTYMSLLPLTLGVMLACSFDMSASNAIGLLCAFGSALIFVSSNIFFKKVMPSGSTSTSHKLDKLNLLFYSSSMAFLLMIPVWVYCDLPVLLATARDPLYISHPAHGSGPSPHAHSLVFYVFANGTVHFAQNIIAFIILAGTSPVTYSIASLIKRVAVILIALAWFATPVHPVQGVGIALTFFGLWMYNNAKGDVEQGERAVRRVEAARSLVLPSTREETDLVDEELSTPVSAMPEVALTSAYGRHAHGRAPEGVLPPSIPTSTSASSPTHPPLSRPPPPRRPSQSHAHAQPPAYSHTHPHPNLHIKITPPSADARARSPVGSYPSPPPSLDSPPMSPGSRRQMPRRGSMATGHGHPYAHPHGALEASAPRAAVGA
ncbi:TPT-domain-containing protein [Obba rivulosa]|uniref:TPT-domain-containing protein n=1 Tax=Obba rivulosa TaxID=1052685 RepID=A0A8E2DVF0_9APHY|nr:TPT-domain-containing protein [Obba rivulosa]